ncbi:protein kinase domain-containing protein [Streptomyces sp. CA-249302]|uniref:protein kinase domain-containing protein n=1 Tax=Streptomyces sp. CA-249302 TaxID=3240058 RepID=UPI003D8EC868
MHGVLLAERFRIGERLGSGGMGEVWAAQDERMRRDVAVKLVHAMFGAREAETQARFRREVQLAGRLSHQNIVTVHDWGEVQMGGRPVFYLVMELVRGVSLGRQLKEGTPPWPRAVGWAAQIADALDAAHRRGVVHRDIKPANVLLTPEGTTKVLDFGVAKFMGETLSVHEPTVTGALLGSPPYMSPEQAEGAREIDHRSDLYSLGCLLYHAVTGRPPFVSDSPLAVLRMQADAPPVPPRDRVGDLPASLNDLILRLLAKDPGDRPADAAAVHDALSTVLVEQSVVVGDGSILEAARLGHADSVAGRLLGKAFVALSEASAIADNAKAEAERFLLEARREASRLGEEAAQDIGAIRAAAREEMEQLRAEARRNVEESADLRAKAAIEAQEVRERAEAEAERILAEFRRVAGAAAGGERNVAQSRAGEPLGPVPAGADAPQQAAYGGPAPGAVPRATQGVRAHEGAKKKFTPFWMTVPTARTLLREDGSREPVDELSPGIWYLAVEPRGSGLLVQSGNGRRGILEDTSGMQRG